MSEPITFDGRVAIITGAGGGLGRTYALELARRGARVVVNDLGGAVDGSGASASAADEVVAEIREAGGEAIANYDSVSTAEGGAAIVESALAEFDTVDIVINNAGILRDRAFANMEMAEIEAVIDVHLKGAFHVSSPAFKVMKEKGYGRFVFTSSNSGLFGNFGQANYGAAKLAVVGLMNTLRAEGAKYDIRVNALAPVAHTRMTEELLPEQAKELLTPEAVTPAVLYLVSRDAPNGIILDAGAGAFAVTRIVETEGVWFPPEDRTPENIAANIDAIMSTLGERELQNGNEQSMKFVGKATGDDARGG